jgi:hypothetical protein
MDPGTPPTPTPGAAGTPGKAAGAGAAAPTPAKLLGNVAGAAAAGAAAGGAVGPTHCQAINFPSIPPLKNVPPEKQPSELEVRDIHWKTLAPGPALRSLTVCLAV